MSNLNIEDIDNAINGHDMQKHLMEMYVWFMKEMYTTYHRALDKFLMEGTSAEMTPEELEAMAFFKDDRYEKAKNSPDDFKGFNNLINTGMK